MPISDYRNKIILTSIELFNSYGCKTVTMDQISSTLHISKRTLYEIFSNKEELLMECLTEVHHRMGQQISELYNKVNDPLMLTIYAVKSALFQNEKYSRFLQDADRYYPQLSRALMQTFTKKFKGSIQNILIQAQKEGDLRENVTIENSVNVLTRSIILWHNFKQQNDQEDLLLINESVFTYLRGLLSYKAIMRYDQREQEFKKLINSSSNVVFDNLTHYNNEQIRR